MKNQTTYRMKNSTLRIPSAQFWLLYTNTVSFGRCRSNNSFEPILKGKHGSIFFPFFLHVFSYSSFTLVLASWCYNCLQRWKTKA